MGSYAYCGSCGKALNPDIRERLKGKVVCPNCNMVRSWGGDRDLAIDEVVDRLEALEEKVINLELFKKEKK
jgi:hypothetical protein